MVTKELTSKLRKAFEAFRYQPDHVKASARNLCKIAEEAFRQIELLEGELAAFKNPDLFEKQRKAKEHADRPTTPRVDRIRAFLAGPHDAPAFQTFLKWNRLTIDDARKLVEEADMPV